MNEKLKAYKDLSLFTMIFEVLEKSIPSTKCNFMYVASPGSSPSKVYMFKDSNNRMYAVKLCNKKIARVSLQKEKRNKEVLNSYLKNHLPNIIGIHEIQDYEIMISECKAIDNLYSSIIHNKQTLDFHFKIWQEVLKEIMTMWNKSKCSYKIEQNPRNNNERIKRIEDGINNTKYNGYLLKDLWNKTIIINNQKYFSLAKAFDLIKSTTNPKFGVTCHGDPQPSNIIIDEQGGWYLVDWEWSGHNHDYRMMFAHLYGWWNTRMSFLKENATFNIDENCIIIKYDLINNEVINIFQKEASKILTKILKISQDDTLNINKFLALLYLGDVRFLSTWGKEAYLPVLIGEAIKTLNYTIKKDSSQVDSRFTFIYEKE